MQNTATCLPIDLQTGPNTHFIAVVMPIPQGECDVRNAHPGPNILGPDPQKDC